MRKALLILLFSLALSAPVLAVDTAGLEEAVPESVRDVLGELTVSDVMSGEEVFQRLRDWAAEQFSEHLCEAGKSAAAALTAALLCSVASAASPDGKMPGYVLLGGALAILGSCMGDMHSFLDQTAAALDELGDFSRALLPCVAASSAAVGQAASGAARYTVSALFLDALLLLGRRAVLPMICAYGAVSAANAALPEGALGGPAKLMRWVCGTLLTGLTTAFTLCLTVSGILTGGADKLAGSAAKTVITAALPVVGKIVADAADTYIAGAKLLRGAIGVFGLAAVLCVCLGPLVRLGLRYLFFKAAACIAEPFADARLAALLGDAASCCGMALGLLGSAGFILFVSVVLGTEALTG